MAYQFADGFDTYGNSTTLTSGYPWDTVVGTCQTSTAVFRFTAPNSTTSGSINIPGSSIIRKNLTASESNLIIGFAFNMASLPGSGQTFLMDCWDSGTSQVSLSVTSAGALQLSQGATNISQGTAVSISANSVITANTWYGVACQIVFASSTGSVQLFLNGSTTPTLNTSNIKTITTANASANQVSLGTQQGSSGVHYDDFFCFDTTGGALNALPGIDTRIISKLPSSAGFYTNWSVTGLGSNWQNAAVTPPSTSDYNSNNTPGTKDSYTMQSTGITVAPLFVLARASLTRDDANTHTPSIFVRSGTTDGPGTVTPALTSGYVYYDAIQLNDPNTGSAWTASAADNAQVGIIEG